MLKYKKSYLITDKIIPKEYIIEANHINFVYPSLDAIKMDNKVPKNIGITDKKSPKVSVENLKLGYNKIK